MSSARAKAAAAIRLAVPNSQLGTSETILKRSSDANAGPRVEFSDLHFYVSESDEADIEEAVREALAKRSPPKTDKQ